MPMRVLREGAGITAAFITVMAFIVVGFAQMLAIVLWGLDVKAPDAWFSGLLSLSSACMGYLIGKNIDHRPGAEYTQREYDDALAAPPGPINGNCPHCGMPIGDVK